MKAVALTLFALSDVVLGFNSVMHPAVQQRLRPPQMSLLSIDNCLVDAQSPYEADECIVAPAAQLEVEEQADIKAFLPVVAGLVGVLLFFATLAPSADQGIGDLGTPQRMETQFEYADESRVPGPPAF